MIDLTKDRLVTRRGKPTAALTLPDTWVPVLQDYASLITSANGLLIRDGVFRVFGVGIDAVSRDVIAWNRAPWRPRFTALSESTVLWGENVFGDQYGLDLVSRRVFLLNCEGGQIDYRPYGSVSECLEKEMLSDDPPIELDLIQQAFKSGLHPGPLEHLSFAMPLIVGGSAEPENLEIMQAGAHLDVLGQIIEQTKDLKEGTPIKKFTG